MWSSAKPLPTEWLADLAALPLSLPPRQIYNPATNSWALGKALPEGRGGTGKAVILNKKVRPGSNAPLRVQLTGAVVAAAWQHQRGSACLGGWSALQAGPTPSAPHHAPRTCADLCTPALCRCRCT